MNRLIRAGGASPVKSALLATALIFACGAAWALDADGDVDLTSAVVSVPGSVTLSTTALPTYVSYNVALTHYSNPELLTNVGFTATTSVLSASNQVVTGQAARFQSFPTGCSANADLTVLTCALPNITDANATYTFSVTVKAPSAGDHVSLMSNASYSEDNGPVQNAPSTTVLTALTAPDPLVVSTFVQPTGGTVYTGTNNGFPAPTPSNTWAALVNVPPIPGGTTASIVNLIADPGCPRAANLLDCSTSKITIPGTFSNLVITLRRDASTITKKANITTAIVYYDQPAHPDPRINYLGFAFHVPACTDTTYGSLPQSGIPCLSARNAVYAPVKDKDKKAKDKDDDKFKNLLYWEFVIQAIDNGRFTN